MRYISIDGKKYRVVATLPYHIAGIQAKIVKDKTAPTGERVVVLDGRKWRFWTAEDRLGVRGRVKSER